MRVIPPQLIDRIYEQAGNHIQPFCIPVVGWDMDTDASKTVTTYVSRANCVALSGIIYADNDALNIAGYPLPYFDSSGVQAWCHFDESAYNTDVIIYRTALGFFDSANFNDGVKIRCILTLWSYV